ncbi:MAG: TolC family protein, partial [Thermoguttaceae bacterium]|nr:TolC family protein [Thermoguttaceae bacterium]
LLAAIFWLCVSPKQTFGVEETLEQAFQTAIAASENVRAEDDAIMAAHMTRMAATGARVPELTLTAGYTALSAQPMLKMDNQMELPIYPLPLDVHMNVRVANQDFATTSAMFTVPLYVGGKIRALEEAGYALVEAAKAGKQVVVADLKLQVMQNYFMIQRLQRLLQVAHAAEKSLEQHEKDVEVLLEQGVITPTAQLSAKAAHAKTKQMIVQVESGLNTARANYNRLMWRPLDTPVELKELEVPPPPKNVEELMARAVAQRQELWKIQSQANAVEAKARSEKAERLPHVAAAAGGMYLQNDYLKDDAYAQGTIGVTWTPLNCTSRAKERAAQNQASSIRRKREEAINGIRVQVVKAYNEELAARQNIETAHEAVLKARENLKMVQEQFKEGIASYSEVLDANALRTQAFTDYFNALYDTLAASYTLRYAMGEL